MKIYQNIVHTLAFLLISCVVLMPAFAAEPMHDESEEVPKGPHGGRLLSAGNFAVELAIFEDGVPPEYHAWAYLNEQEVRLQDWSLTVTLTRLGGRTDNFTFTQSAGYLLGQGEVEEPHSFDVEVYAEYQGGSQRWSFPSYEGRLQLAAALAEELHVETAVAGPGVLHQSILLYGKITPDPQGISHITARYPGLIRSISANLGERVAANDKLAVIEANSSLQTYTITAPISGLVIQRHANPGEFAGEQPLLTIADYSRLWVDLDVFPGDAQLIKPGQAVSVRMGELNAQSSIVYLNPGAGETPNVVARVPLDNRTGMWTPGLLVEGDAVVAEEQVPLLVETRAIQSFRDWQVVFIKIGEAYEIRPLTLGRSNGRVTEVLAGLEAGDEYVVVNSYLLKADLEKSGAKHDH